MLVRLAFFVLAAIAIGGLFAHNQTLRMQTAEASGKFLAEARQEFTTKLARQEKSREAIPEPPAKLFKRVKFDSPVGSLAAYVTPDQKDGKRRPAIVWVTGGDNALGDVWTPAPATNDQTARAYRDAGIVMMFPSFRGTNNNPGYKESFYGEVDDVLAAASYLSKLPYVDPTHIYLGGHSTGGTLVLLAAEMPNRFRAVFSFGPVPDISVHRPAHRAAVNMADRKEIELRSPGKWLHSIQSPTFVFEGGAGPSNAYGLRAMSEATNNPNAHFFEVKSANHFTILSPTNKLIAQKILADTGEKTNLSFTAAELNKLFSGQTGAPGNDLSTSRL
jgi:acetyl esterase/lipase